MSFDDLQLLEFIENPESSGLFVSKGAARRADIRVEVEGFGELGFPLNDWQCKGLIETAAIQAPFGKGSETVVDTTVRKTWEIDASKVRISGDKWKKTEAEIVGFVKEDFAMESFDVEAKLYKMLIYEEGSFFLPHKDSEKETGMFATLSINLPCWHTGGDLIVTFDGEEETVRFAAEYNPNMVGFAAFYADCTHEIKPITAGYRVCLIYNLIQKGVEKNLSPNLSDKVRELAAILKAQGMEKDKALKVILLKHEYTPDGFELDKLKGDDRGMVQLVREAAEDAGYYTKLGLITHYKMGELEGDYDDDYYYSRRNRNVEDGGMGEVYEETTSVSVWLEDDETNTPVLKGLKIDPKNIISRAQIGAGEPNEIEREGYTGNEGMTCEHWYHYGALFLWREADTVEVLRKTDLNGRMDWLRFYLKKAKKKPTYQNTVKQFYAELLEVTNELAKARVECTDLVAVVLERGNELLVKPLVEKLGNVIHLVDEEMLSKLFEKFGAKTFVPAFRSVKTVAGFKEFLGFLKVAKILAYQNQAVALLLANDFPAAIRNLYAENTYPSHLRDEADSALIEFLKTAAILERLDEHWAEIVANAIIATHQTKRFNALVEILTKERLIKNHTTQIVRRQLREALEQRVSQKPMPPTDATRHFPDVMKIPNVPPETFETLRAFVLSPTETTLLIRAKAEIRNPIEGFIQTHDLDLNKATVKDKSPHGLVLTKNQRSYSYKLAVWERDSAELKKIMVDLQ